MAKLRLTPPGRAHVAAPAAINDVFSATTERLDVFLAPPLDASGAPYLASLVRAIDRGHYTRHNWSALDDAAIADLCRHVAASITVDYVHGGEIRVSDDADPAVPRALWVAAVRVSAPAVAAHIVVAADRDGLERFLTEAGAKYADALDFDLSPAERQRFAQKLQSRRDETESAEDEIEREFAEEERKSGKKQKVKFVPGDADSSERLRREQMESAASAKGTDWQRPAPDPAATAAPLGAAEQTRARREELKHAAAKSAELGANEARGDRAEFVQYAGRPEDMRSRTGDVRARVERAQASGIKSIRRNEEEWAAANEGNVSAWHRNRMAANARKHTPSAVARANAAGAKRV
jgi:hypothetical protein